MAVRSNLTGFTINSAVIPYEIASGITIGRGDPIRLIETNGNFTITNNIGDYPVDGVARTAGTAGETIPVHIFKYRNTWGDVKPYKYSQLKNFTYGDLTRLYLPFYL